MFSILSHRVICTLFFIFVSSQIIQASTKEPSITDLDWLIGKWQYNDVAVKGAYTDKGIRICEYTLNKSYIACLSDGVTNTGKKRSYYFYFNYNKLDKRFEITSLTSDYPRKNLYIVTVQENNHKLSLTSKSWTKDGMVDNNTAAITYNGKNIWLWKIRYGEADPETGIIPVSYIDKSTRID